MVADIWVVCDGPVHQSGRPQVVFGVRGIADVEITVFGPAGDLHSGHYGNWAPNPAALLAELLAGMRDEHGVPTIDGLEAPDPFGSGRRGGRRRSRFPTALGFPAPAGPSLWERNLRPLLNVRGLRAGRRRGGGPQRRAPARRWRRSTCVWWPGRTRPRVIEAIRGHVAARGFHLVDGPPDAETRLAHRRIAMVAGHAVVSGRARPARTIRPRRESWPRSKRPPGRRPS